MLYLDDETQTVVGVAEYPETMDDAREAYVSVSLDDQNGDGYSDLRAVFASPSGERDGAELALGRGKRRVRLPDRQQRISTQKSGDARTLSRRRCFLRTQSKSEGAAKNFLRQFCTIL